MENTTEIESTTTLNDEINKKPKKIFKVCITIIVALLAVAIGVLGYFVFRLSDDLSVMKSELDESNSTKQSMQLSIDMLKAKVDNISTDMDERFVDMFSLIFDTSVGSPKATLDLTTKSYSSVKHSLGYFMVSVEDVQSYLSGCKVDLRIGNPASVDFNGLEITAEYGKEKDNLKTQTVSVTNTIYSGSWNYVQIILPDVLITDLSNLSVRIFTDSVSATNRK